MLAKYITTGMVGSLLLASAALAEPPTVPQTQLQGDWRASKVVGLNVYNDGNENVGSINELLMDKSGNIKAAVLSVGGFLGMGAHYVAVPFDKIKFSNEPVSYAATSTKPNTDARPQSTTTGSTATAKPNPWYPDHAVFNANKDELKSMPEFNFSND
jgi:sporulation protein YlmC with PRC-barrel domain